jgi:type II secretion system protein D
MEIDVNRSNVKLEVRTFTLKNTLAEDLRQTMTNAIMPAAVGTPGTGPQYPILEILSVDDESKKLISSGIMKDVKISANPYKQQLIVTAPSDCMELIATLIATLDVPAQSGQLKIFSIRNGDATQIQKTLSTILATSTGSMPAIPNSKGEVSFVPVRLSVDSRTNSILVTGAPGDLKMIDALITVLDRKDSEERQMELISLRTVRASSVADSINKYLAEKQKLEMTSETISDHQLFESQIIVIPEPNTNSIILSASPKHMDEIKALIEQFDKEPQQVVIQVLIAEVTLTDQEEFGIEAGLQDKVAFDRSVITNVTNSSSTIGNPGYDFINTNSQGNAYNSGTDPTDIAGQVLNNLGMGRTDADLGYGGLVLSASSRSVQLVLRALRDKNRLQVLSRPQIQAMDNQQAFILIGQRVPRVSGASTTTYGVTSNVVDANVGLILLVTPRISKDGRVIMEIGAEKSSLGSSSDAIPVFSSEGQVITSPTIETRQLMTAVSAQNGETVMLGGMISSSKEKISRGVPYLSDIPVLGWLFRYDRDTEQRRELLIVMTPRIVESTEDVNEIKRIEASKMSWCLADAMEINSDMGLNDPLNTRRTPKRTRLLPFLEMEEMEELPPSTIRPRGTDNQTQGNPSLR